MNLIAELSTLVHRKKLPPEQPLTEKGLNFSFQAWVIEQARLAERTDAIIKMEELGVGQQTIHDYLDKSKF